MSCNALNDIKVGRTWEEKWPIINVIIIIKDGWYILRIINVPYFF